MRFGPSVPTIVSLPLPVLTSSKLLTLSASPAAPSGPGSAVDRVLAGAADQPVALGAAADLVVAVAAVDLLAEARVAAREHVVAGVATDVTRARDRVRPVASEDARAQGGLGEHVVVA